MCLAVSGNECVFVNLTNFRSLVFEHHSVVWRCGVSIQFLREHRITVIAIPFNGIQ